MAERGPSSRLLSGLEALPRAFGEPLPEPEPALDDTPDPVEVAYEQGVRDGRAAAEEEAAERQRVACDALRLAISETVKTLVDLRARTTREHEQAMFQLALNAASLMLRAKIDAADPVASRALEEALDALPKSAQVKARVHPEDIESIRRDLAREVESEQVALVADDSVGRGGCLVESDAGSIDATVETATALVAEAARC